MKKFQLLFLLLFTSTLLNAGTIEKTWYIGDYTLSEAGDYQILQIENSLTTGITGHPALPYQTVKLLLPPGEKAVSIEFTGEDEIQLTGFNNLYPQQSSRPLSDPGDGQFIINEQIYNTNAFYPEKQTGELSTSFMNGYAFALSSFTPVRYNPVTGVVSIYKKVKITIKTAPDKNAAKALQNLRSSENILERVKNYAQNPSLLKQYPSSSVKSDDYQLLIITPSQFENDFQSLIDIYLQRGIKTEVVTKESINATGTGQDLQEKIRNFIIQEYQDFGVEFVLLGGDVEHIPYRGFYCYVQSGSGYTDNNIPADLYYSALDGSWNDDNDNSWGEIGEDDLLPEVAVARFSFSNISELNNMINKTISYQNDPVLGELTNALMAGEWLYNSPITYGSDYLELLIGYHDDNGYETWGIPESYNFEKLYEVNQSWGANDLISAINSGKQFVHHCGHANSNYVAFMSNSDITNSNFYGANGVDHNFTIMLSHGCICGAFDDSDCIMEKMVSIENFAVAVVGNSRYGWFNEGQTEGPAAHLHREMVDALYHEKMNHIGQAFVECKIQTAPWVTAPGQWEEGALRWNFYDINILGDPTLSVWTDEPIDIEVNHLGIYFMGVDSYEVTVTSGGEPMENFHCAVLYDGEIYGAGLTDENGYVDIEMELLIEPGEAELIVSGYNCLPQSYTVMIVPPGPSYIFIDDYQINDPTGNGNGELDYGESVTMDLTLGNIGTEQAENVEAEIETTNPNVTIIDGFENFGSIGPNGTQTISDAFSFEVADNAPDQHIVIFDATLSWTDDFVTTQFAEIINAPVLDPGSISVDDSQSGNGNGLLDPGEIADIHIEILNIGHSTSEEVECNISSTSPYVTINTSNCTVGSVAPENSETAIFTIEIDENTPIGQSIDLFAEFIAGNYMAQYNYFLSVGLIFEDFETGDFSAFGWEFGGNANWTISNQNPYEGTYCAKSGNIGDQQESELILTMDVLADDEISFFRKVSSEPSYDYLRFYIDGVQKDEWAGEEGWDEVSYPVTEGSHTFKWAYEKDYSVSNGDDCAWVDYIVFPASSGSGNVLSVNASAIPADICLGESSQLNAYSWGGSGNYTYLWSPITGLSNPNIANPIATPDETITYTVTVDDGNSNISDNVTITVHPIPETPTISQEDDHLVSSATTGNQWYDSNGLIAGATGQTYYPIATDNFYVIITNEFGCDSEQSNVIYFLCTFIDEYSDSNFNIYPNPFVSHFSIEYQLTSNSKIILTLLNKLGQGVEILLKNSKQTAGFYSLDFSKPDLQPGIYFIRIETEKDYMIRKLVLSK